MSARSPEEIEAEVVEIDGLAPAARPAAEPDDAPTPGFDNHHQWRGQIRRLDARWWPLWVILGVLAIVFLATVGLVIGVVLLLVRFVLGMLSAIVRLITPPAARG